MCIICYSHRRVSGILPAVTLPPTTTTFTDNAVTTKGTTMMNFPIIQSLWIGNPLSNLKNLCIHSFLDHSRNRKYVQEYSQAVEPPSKQNYSSRNGGAVVGQPATTDYCRMEAIPAIFFATKDHQPGAASKPVKVSQVVLRRIVEKSVLSRCLTAPNTRWSCGHALPV